MLTLNVVQTMKSITTIRITLPKWLLVSLILGILLNDRLVAQPQPLESLAPKALASLASTVLYFGDNVRMSADIAAEANIPANELSIAYKFLGDERIEDAYRVPFVGALIPGYARKIEVEISRKLLLASVAKKQVLWSNTYEVQQIAPTFDASKASVEATSGKGKSAKPGDCSFAIKGLRVDFAKPVDADKNRVVTALVNDLEVTDPEADTAKTSLQFFTANTLDEKLSNAVKPEMVSVSGFFDAGVFLVTVALKGLPKMSLKGKTLRGTIGIKLQVKLLNRRAMRSASAVETMLVPVVLTF